MLVFRSPLSFFDSKVSTSAVRDNQHDTTVMKCTGNSAAPPEIQLVNNNCMRVVCRFRMAWAGYRHKYRHSNICLLAKGIETNVSGRVYPAAQKCSSCGREGYVIKKHAYVLTGSDNSRCCRFNFFVSMGNNRR